MSNIPQNATLSDDGNYWWDGQAWQPVSGNNPTEQPNPPEQTASDPGTDGANTEQPSRGLVAEEGGVVLYIPNSGATTAAIFAHGVADGEIDPISGVSLGYYTAHGDPLDANITWAEGNPGFGPQKVEGDAQGKWASYVLSQIPLADNDRAQLDLRANEYGIAIAYVVEAMTTSTIVGMLSGKGYSDIRAVHCRGAEDDVDEPTFAAGTEISHEDLINQGWKDSGGELISPVTEITDGEAVQNGNDEYFKISVVQPGSSYRVEKYG